MSAIHRAMLRAAALVHQFLHRRRLAQGDIFLPEHAWVRAKAALARRDLSRRRGWLRAMAHVNQDLIYELGYLRTQIDHVINVLEQPDRLQPFPRPADIYREILALEDEFAEVRVDLKRGYLKAVTERIVLADIDLGPFEIQLELKRLGESSCYRIVALDPHPAGGDDSVTHPHVQDCHLCEGQGYEAIQMALAEGRLADFFLIVSRLLATYSRGHAYIELSEWSGVPCSDCGDTVRERSAASCSSCESWLCDDCRNDCTICQAGFCQGCLNVCPCCSNQCCNDCLIHCDACRRSVCNRCLANGVCRICRSRKSPTQDTNHASDIPTSPQAA